MKWSIVTDSSCDLSLDQNPGTINFEKVPFIINLGEKSFLDTEDLDLPAFIDEMSNYKLLGQTACPSPGTWFDCFEKADNVIAITISSKLSGSYNSAQSAKEMVLETHPDKNICILDSYSAGPALAMLVLKAMELIEQNLEFDVVTAQLKDYAKSMNTVFVLSSFDNLIKSGRLSKISGFIAGKLNLQGIGVGNKGLIELKHKARGYKKSVQFLIEEMKTNSFIDGKIIISHCQNLEVAQIIQNEINKIWNDKIVYILETSGLCSFYAEHKGIIVSY